MQHTHGHTLKAFDQDLAELRGVIVDMGAFAEAAIEEAMRCLMERDTAAAVELVQADEQLDELEADAERRVIQLIALRAPMADDLREVVASLKIAGVVERIGDYAKNIARRVRRLEGDIEPLSLLPEMAKMASAMVHDVLQAFVERDPAAARRVVNEPVPRVSRRKRHRAGSNERDLDRFRRACARCRMPGWRPLTISTTASSAPC